MDDEIFPIVKHFKECLQSFQQNARQIAVKKGVPGWFNDFSKHLESFADDISSTLMKLENSNNQLVSKLAIQKAVTDGLVSDRLHLQEQIERLQADLEDQRQYSRRTNLLFHGLDENAKENTDDLVLGILNNQLELPLTKNDVGRTHRLGKK